MQKPTKKSAKRTAKTIVHPTAIVHPKARLGAGVVVGPYTVIDAQVSVGPRTRIGAHCVIEGRTMIGEECEIFTGAVIGSPPQDLKYRGEASELIIGDRNKIREYVTLNPGTEGGGGKTVIGSDCLLMAYAHVAHDCIVGSRVIIANSAALAGHITVEDRATIGGLVGVHQFVRVGTTAMIAGQARVAKDVPPFVLVMGDSEVCGLNVVGMRRVGMSTAERLAVKRVYRVVYRSGLNVSQAEARLRAMPPNPAVHAWLSCIEASTRGLCSSRRRATTLTYPSSEVQ